MPGCANEDTERNNDIKKMIRFFILEKLKTGKIPAKKQYYTKTGIPEVACLFNHLTMKNDQSLCLCHLSHKFFLISKRAFAGYKFEIFMKAGKIIKAAFIAKLFNAQVIFNKQLTSMAHSYFN